MPRIRGVVAESKEPAPGPGMKFVVDAHLPVRLVAVLAANGHEAIHTSQLPEENETTDAVINELSIREQRVVITKDSDFYHSHVLHGKPWKLLLVCTGNIRTRELKQLFEAHLQIITTALATHSLVEIDRQQVRIVK